MGEDSYFLQKDILNMESVADDIGPAMSSYKDEELFRRAKNEEIYLLNRIEQNIKAGAFTQASIMIDKLKDENLKKIALALLPNPYDRNN